MTVDPVTLEVHALAGLNLEGLRSEWRKRYGPPPPLRSIELLGLLLAYRIQADAFGGLEPETLKALGASAAKPSVAAKLGDGTVIAREWKGVRHEVEVTSGGFLYQGRRFGSLSAIAREISGVRWNGPRFFGLRTAAKPDGRS